MEDNPTTAVEARLGGRRPRILLAEDHAVNRQVIDLILTPLDVDLIMVEDGAQAVDAVGRADFDLILMDMQMPVMDGLTATRRIREMEAARGRRRTPIIAVTANAMPEQIAATLEAGVDSHFAKPVTAEALTNVVLAALGLDADVQPRPVGRKSAA